jgi:hypothetical protein
MPSEVLDGHCGRIRRTPDLKRSGYHLFGPLKKPSSTKYANDEALRNIVRQCLQRRESDFDGAEIRAPVHRCMTVAND